MPPEVRLSKLSPPLAPPWAITRARLAGSGQIPATKLILVNAPAGFGKTTLLLQWHAQLTANRIATAWLNLDEADNDLTRFLTYLFTSVHALVPDLDFPIPAVSLPHQGGKPVGILTDLIDRLANRAERFVLFLDDFEHISNPLVLDVVRRLADELPSRQQLVVSTRHAPEIGFARLRVRGLAIEFGIEALRFSEQETRTFALEKRQLALSDDEIQALQRHTEGWPAALHLAALSLIEQPGNATALLGRLANSANTGVALYLSEDVFTRQPQDIRDFLLYTCILERLSASLCDAVTGRNDSASFLERLERNNLFLTPLDVQRSWYRYHKLFADFLLVRLRSCGISAASLHRRAAAWHADRHWWIAAVSHAQATGDSDFAADLMQQASADTLYAGRANTLAAWVETLPSEILGARWDLEVNYIWALAFSYRYGEAYGRLEPLSARLTGPDGSEAQNGDDLTALEVILLGLTDRFEPAYSVGIEALKRISDDGPFGRGIIATTVAYATIAASRFSETPHFIDLARESHHRANSALGLIHCECLEGMSNLAQGRLESAERHFTRAVTQAEDAQLANSPAGATATVYLVEVLYEQNRLDECKRRLLHQLPIICECGLWDFLVQSHRTLMLLARSNKDWESAIRWTKELEEFGHRWNVPRVVASARLLGAGLAIDLGDLDGAARLLDLAQTGADWQRYEHWRPFSNDLLTPDIVRLRLDLARGDNGSVLTALIPMLNQAESLRRRHRALMLRVLWIKVLVASGDDAAATAMLTETMPETLRIGYRRMFLDEIEIPRLLRSQHLESFLRILIPPGLARSVHEDKASPVGVGSGRSAVGAAGETLTERETQVLRLAADGLSNRAIAERLFLSEATVKFHLRNINAKIGTHSRTQAIAIVRALGVLD